MSAQRVPPPDGDAPHELFEVATRRDADNAPDLVAFTFDDVDPFAVGNELWRQGWYCDQQGTPPSLLCTVTAGHVAVVEEFVAAIAAAVGSVRSASGHAERAPYAALD